MGADAALYVSSGMENSFNHLASFFLAYATGSCPGRRVTKRRRSCNDDVQASRPAREADWSFWKLDDQARDRAEKEDPTSFVACRKSDCIAAAGMLSVFHKYQMAQPMLTPCLPTIHPAVNVKSSSVPYNASQTKSKFTALSTPLGLPWCKSCVRKPHSVYSHIGASVCTFSQQVELGLDTTHSDKLSSITLLGHIQACIDWKTSFEAGPIRVPLRQAVHHCRTTRSLRSPLSRRLHCSNCLSRHASPRGRLLHASLLSKNRKILFACRRQRPCLLRRQCFHLRQVIIGLFLVTQSTAVYLSPTSCNP